MERAPSMDRFLVFQGTVYTVEPKSSPWADFVVVRNDSIVHVLRKSESGFEDKRSSIISALQKSAESAQISLSIINIPPDQLLIPGFHDAHCHLFASGMELLLTLTLAQQKSLSSALQALKAFADEHPDREWIIGSGYQREWFTNSRGIPSYRDLDAIIPSIPVVITSFDGHSCWANSIAMRRAGIDPNQPIILAPNQENLELFTLTDRDPVTNLPLGCFHEIMVHRVLNSVPPSMKAGILTDYVDHKMEDRAAGLAIALNLAAQNGITACNDALVKWGNAEAYAEADRQGKLTAKVYASIHGDKAQDKLALVRKAKQAFHGNRFKVTCAKLFMDGVIESETALLEEAYKPLGEDRSDPHYQCHKGVAHYAEDQLLKDVQELDREGIQVHMHAIGDAAVKMALDAVEHVRKVNGVASTTLHHIAHLQVVNPREYERFARLNVAANFQPYWSMADKDMVSLTIPRLGEERAQWQYPIRSILDTGAVVGFGSDWNVSNLNPIDGIQVAVTHLPLPLPKNKKEEAEKGKEEEEEEEGWNPKQKISVEEAVYLYTMGSAKILKCEKESGSIEEGKLADLVVLSRNILRIPAREIYTAKVVMTFVDGEKVWERQ